MAGMPPGLAAYMAKKKAGKTPMAAAASAKVAESAAPLATGKKNNFNFAPKKKV